MDDWWHYRQIKDFILNGYASSYHKLVKLMMNYVLKLNP